MQEPPREDRHASPCTETQPTGPGRPPGSKNQRTATRYDVGRVLATGVLIAMTRTMLDSRMVRRKKEKQKRPAWGIPKGIVLLATPEGWRHSVLTMEGGMLCGRLDVPINTDPHDARAVAARMVTERTP
ncbi:hypothetical protein [Streptomyces sp. NPDC091273]|uniref:hypothetical protein n=1 Tax=unclassified Streptomyces TaxID=2593676 RepID=UPI00380E699A